MGKIETARNIDGSKRGTRENEGNRLMTDLER